MFAWRKDQIDLKKLMGLKLWHPEWDLCDYLRLSCLLVDGSSSYLSWQQRQRWPFRILQQDLLLLDIRPKKISILGVQMKSR
jgi:hypothetical protein